MNPPAPRPPADGERLKAGEYIGYALGDTASNLFFKTFTIFLPFYYVDVWGIPNKALLWITPVVGLIGAFTDPIMGLPTGQIPVGASFVHTSSLARSPTASAAI